MVMFVCECIIYIFFWFVVFFIKIVFGYFFFIIFLREVVNALKKGDLCWNKESDEYILCINFEGDVFV